MIGFIIFIIVLVFVIIPLYKSIRKSGASKKLNEELVVLAAKYDLCMLHGNFADAERCLDQARIEVRRFTSDIKLSPQELAQVVPGVTRFPLWYAWL